MPTRRALLGAVGMAAGLSPAFLSSASSAAAAPIALPPPITVAERKARIAKLQSLLQARSVGGLLVEAGSSLDYFTGAQWRLSERTTAAIIPAEGEPIIVCPFFEEPSIRETLAVGEVRTCRVGVWVDRKEPGLPVREEKIAAIGVKIRRWVSFHGISLNVEPDLTHFSGIIPCGITEHGVTSLVDQGLPVSMDEVDAALKASFERVFGPVIEAEAPV